MRIVAPIDGGEFEESRGCGDDPVIVEEESKDSAEDRGALGARHREESGREEAHGAKIGEASREEEGEAPRMRHPPVPKPPSRAERERHEIMHLPYRSWCRVCVKSRGISSQHKSKGINYGQCAIPQVSFDYCFVAGTVLVMKDSVSKSIMSTVVPAKGAAHDWVINKAAKWVEDLGYKRVILNAIRKMP